MGDRETVTEEVTETVREGEEDPEGVLEGVRVGEMDLLPDADGEGVGEEEAYVKDHCIPTGPSVVPLNIATIQ